MARSPKLTGEITVLTRNKARSRPFERWSQLPRCAIESSDSETFRLSSVTIADPLRTAMNILIVGFELDADRALDRSFRRLVERLTRAAADAPQLQVCDGSETLRHWLTTPPCLGVLVNGDRPDATDWIAIARQQAADLPVVVLRSDEGSDAEECRVYEAGADNVFARSQFAPEGLATTLALALQAYRWRNERDRQREQFERDRGQHRLVLEGSQEAIWDWNLADDRLECSPRLANMLGRCDADLPGCYDDFCQLVHPDDRELVRSLQAGDRPSYRLDLRLRHADGDYRTCVLRAKVQRDAQNRPLRVAGVINDISDRKRAEERIAEQNWLLAAQNQELKAQRERIQQQHLAVLEASRLKSAFLATMSHELRTPLNVVIGFSQLLLRQKHRDLNPLQQQTVECILNNGKHLLSLLDNILDRAQLEAGGFELNPRPLNLVQLVSNTVGNLRSRGEERGLPLRLHVQVDNPIVVNDYQRLRRILLHLLDNAFKFTKRGSVTVRLWEPHPDRLAFSVTDTGIGLAPEDLKRIFATFEQIDDTLDRVYGGTGLGLAIVDALVKMMGGNISVESELGRGSTFRIELPRVARGVPVEDSPRSPLPLHHQAS